MAALNVEKCTSCGRLTPTKHGECIYCQTSLASRLRRRGREQKKQEPGHEEPRALGANRKSRFVKQADDRSHYLVVETREPIALEAGKLFVIGRDPRASLVVHSSDVSRQHAEIDWDDHDPPRPLLCEVRSTNGTYLNGELVTREAPQPLRSGDDIRLGDSFTLTYIHAHERDVKTELQERGRHETRKFRRADVAPANGSTDHEAEPGAAAPAAPATGGIHDVVAAMGADLDPGVPLEGSLSNIPGFDLLKRLHALKSSGTLTLFDGQNTGELSLENGRCTRARFAGLTGRTALEHVAKLRSGMYTFRPDGASAEPPPEHLGLTQVLAPMRRPSGDGAPAARPAPAGPPPGARPFPLAGSLRELPGQELLRLLQGEKRSGTLRVFDGQGAGGEVVLVDGVCERASLAGRAGDDALDYLMSLGRGTYRFRPDVPAPLPLEDLEGTAVVPRLRPPPPPMRAVRVEGSGPARAPIRSESGTGSRIMPLRKPSAREQRPRSPLRPPSERSIRPPGEGAPTGREARPGSERLPAASREPRSGGERPPAASREPRSGSERLPAASRDPRSGSERLPASREPRSGSERLPASREPRSGSERLPAGRPTRPPPPRPRRPAPSDQGAVRPPRPPGPRPRPPARPPSGVRRQPPPLPHRPD